MKVGTSFTFLHWVLLSIYSHHAILFVDKTECLECKFVTDEPLVPFLRKTASFFRLGAAVGYATLLFLTKCVAYVFSMFASPVLENLKSIFLPFPQDL